MSKVQLRRGDGFEHRVCAHGTKAAGRKKEAREGEKQKKQTATERYFLAQAKSEALKM